MAAPMLNADFLASAPVSLDINAPPQFNEDELAAAFSNISVKDAPAPQQPTPAPFQSTRLVGPTGRYHELQLDFPALDLLNKGQERFLIHEPKEIIFRERPNLGTFHLRGAKNGSPDNLTFSVKLETPLSVGESFLLPATLQWIEQYDSIIELVQRLSCLCGISNLEVLQFQQLGGVERIRLRLTTTWLLATGYSLREEKTYEYTTDEWQRIRAACKDTKWMQVLNNLVDRASDRAYLSVREKMKKADPELVESDDSFIDKKWKMYEIGSPNIVLFRCLDNFKKQVVEETGWGGTEQQYLVELECGHRISVSLVYVLHRMSEEEVKSMCCAFCGQRVLADRHLRRIEILHEQAKRALFVYKQPMWKALKAKFANHTFRMRVSDLAAALHDTLDMMRVPESASPRELDPVNAPETQAILQSFVTAFGHNYIEMSAAFRFDKRDTRCLTMLNALRVLRLYTGLVNFSLTELKRALPPLYFRFLAQWFTRAILLSAARVAEQNDKAAQEAARTAQGFAGMNM